MAVVSVSLSGRSIQGATSLQHARQYLAGCSIEARLPITDVAGAKPSPNGSQNYMAHVAWQLAELHILAPRELCDLEVELNNSERVVIAKWVRDGVACEQPSDYRTSIDADRNITQQIFDDALEIGMSLRDPVTQTPALGSVEYDLKSFCDGARAICLGQPGSVQQHIEPSRKALYNIGLCRRFGRARGGGR